MPSDESFDRAEFVAYFRDEAEELLSRIEADSLILESHVAAGTFDGEVVNGLFRALHTLKGNAAMLGFSEIADVAHRLESLCDRMRSQRTASAQSVELLFGGRDILTALVAAPAGARPPAGLTDFLARLEPAEAPQGETEAFEAEVARMLAERGPKTTSPHLPLQTGRRPTIRVDIERLDALLNLVGELVVSRTRISEIAASLAHVDREGEIAKTLSESAAILSRTAGEIQESLMRIRMVPIGQVFERFPRLVRDVAKARQKEVDLEVTGAQTELDKTIVDEIGEPLMHLLRNCIDHGIELPEERAAAGKTRAGKIRLSSYHEGNQVLIEIADDGNGIDLGRVRGRAIELGLVSPQQHLTDEEIVELIFTPGFSTADEVSDVSGRGMGMDVVKKSITHLKGHLEVDTEQGRGTRFTIKLPLTLAIITALLVQVGRARYALPLDSVVESQRVELSDLRLLHGNEVLMVRGEIVPLVRVAEFFGLDAQRDPEKAMVVIVSVQGRQVGLIVDAFEGEQEVVIKPLSDVVGRIAGISGATILGSGAIALILDVHALVGEAYASGRVARAEYSAAKG
jgi:two-component system, chemotaxis family, sensor kinase CheA